MSVYRYSMFIALSLLLLSAALLAGDPTTGDVRLRLKDANQKPVVNATAVIRYEYTDPNYGVVNKVDKVYSDGLGIVDHRIVADFNAPLTATIEINNINSTTSYTWMGGIDRFINLPLTDFTVKTVDSQGTVLPNVPLVLTSDGFSKNATTNGSGYAVFTHYNEDLQLNITALYGGEEWGESFTPDGSLVVIQVPTHSLEVKISDEFGHLIEGDFVLYYTAVDPQVKTSHGVVALFSQIPEGTVQVNTSYDGRSQSHEFYLNYSSTKTYVFDLNPPYISPPWTKPEDPVPENEVFVYVESFDEGMNASGMPEQVNMIPPVELYYSTDGVNWEMVYMFQEGNTTIYKGKVPGQPQDTVVRYTIYAYDNAGNSKNTTQYNYNTAVASNGGGDDQEDGLLKAISEFWYLPIALAVLASLLLLIKKKYL